MDKLLDAAEFLLKEAARRGDPHVKRVAGVHLTALAGYRPAFHVEDTEVLIPRGLDAANFADLDQIEQEAAAGLDMSVEELQKAAAEAAGVKR